MYAFSSYNKIWMVSKDEEKTIFTTDKDFFYYRIMPFGLINTRATYQRLVNKTLKEYNRSNMKSRLIKYWSKDKKLNDTSKNGQTYLDSHMARHITH